jgi:hypothetical protein
MAAHVSPACGTRASHVCAAMTEGFKLTMFTWIGRDPGLMGLSLSRDLHESWASVRCQWYWAAANHLGLPQAVTNNAEQLTNNAL